MRTANEMIAYTLETDPSLLPYIPELLADLDALGSNAELIVQVLKDLNLPRSTRVIDLGCGKGAVAVEIATQLGLQVLGIELFEPFVRACSNLARAKNVSHLCEFIQGEIVELAGRQEPADLVIFAALGDVLGGLDETIRVIRQYVKPGGFILVSDSYIKHRGSSRFPRFENYANHRETMRRLTSMEDTLVREVSELFEQAAEDDESALILARGKRLAKQHPELSKVLFEYTEVQFAENDYIGRNMIGAVWVLERAD